MTISSHGFLACKSSTGSVIFATNQHLNVLPVHVLKGGGRILLVANGNQKTFPSTMLHYIYLESVKMKETFYTRYKIRLLTQQTSLHNLTSGKKIRNLLNYYLQNKIQQELIFLKNGISWRRNKGRWKTSTLKGISHG